MLLLFEYDFWCNILLQHKPWKDLRSKDSGQIVMLKVVVVYVNSQVFFRHFTLSSPKPTFLLTFVVVVVVTLDRWLEVEKKILQLLFLFTVHFQRTRQQPEFCSYLWFGFVRWKGSLKALIILSYFIFYLHTCISELCCCMLSIRCCKITVENVWFVMAKKTTGLMNSSVWLGHWWRVLTCLYKTDRQQTSDIQQWLTWQTGNQQSRYLLIYFVWIKCIWFYVWSTCPCTYLLQCRIMRGH